MMSTNIAEPTKGMTVTIPKTPLTIASILLVTLAIIVTIGWTITNKAADAAYLAYNAADFGDDNYDTLQTAWHNASSNGEVWAAALPVAWTGLVLLVLTWVIVKAIQSTRVNPSI